MNIRHIFEPTPLQCGQAVLSMVTGIEVNKVSLILNTRKETTLKEMICFFEEHGFSVCSEKTAVVGKSELPGLCFLSLETPKCWHWSLYSDGVFYDPEHGVLTDFPESRRRYYWKLKKK